MTFIYFTDDEGDEIGIPLESIVQLAYKKEKDPADNSLDISVKSGSIYEIWGAAADKAWGEIRIQIMASDRHKPIGMP